MSTIAFGPERGRVSDHLDRARVAATALLQGHVSFARNTIKAPVSVEAARPGIAHRLSEFAYGGLAKIVGMRSYKPRHAAGQSVPQMARDVLPAGGVFTEDAVITSTGYKPQVMQAEQHATPSSETPQAAAVPEASAPALSPQPNPIATAAHLSTPPGFE